MNLFSLSVFSNTSHNLNINFFAVYLQSKVLAAFVDGHRDVVWHH